MVSFCTPFEISVKTLDGDDFESQNMPKYLCWIVELITCYLFDALICPKYFDTGKAGF